MAFFTNPVLGTSKVDATQQSTSGRKMHTIPATSPTLTNSSAIIPSCSGCSQEATHDVCRAIRYSVPWDESRYERVTQSGRPDRAEFNRLQSALFILGHIGNGLIGDEILFNAGAANNGSQFVEYEIVSTSGSTITLKGPNPKRIPIGISRLNPNWPLDDDPINGTPARIQTDTVYIALPVGAEVQFLSPSVLAGKLRPWIESITVPASTAMDDVTFTVTLSASATEAQTPYDNGVVDDDHVYKCRVRFEAALPATWANVQSPRERAWHKVTQVISSATNAELLNKDAGSTRILWPDMSSSVILFEAVVYFNDSSELVLDPFEEVGGNPRLVTVQSGGSWETHFNVSDLTFGANPTDVDEVQVTYWHEATDGTAPFLHHTSQCANSQREISGSYVHDDGHRCMNVNASGFGNYQRECWQPGGCDGFTLGDETNYYGSVAILPVSNYGDPRWWSGFWHRESWFIEQVVGGNSRDFFLGRPSMCGPSVQSLVGSWVNQVPVGKFSRREPWFGPAWGKRVTWDDAGDEFHMLVHGAFYEEGYVTDTDNFWDASTTPDAGAIAAVVTGWDTKVDSTGSSMRAALRRLPYRYTGRVNLYTYEHENASLGRTNIRQTNSEAFVTNADLSVVDESLNSQIQAIY